MKACVIIAEYNPFHNGHAFQIEQARQKSQADVVIAVMSGNFVQRGELAIIDKWKRTEVALSCGVDLVVELPTMAVIQSADYFAYEAMRLVEVLHASVLSFGAETADLRVLENIATVLGWHQFSREHGKRYHQQVVEFIRSAMGDVAANVLDMPNNQLALGYMKAAQQLGLNIGMLPIQRTAAQHFEQRIGHESIASGTAIRKRVSCGENVEQFVPLGMARYLEQAKAVDFWTLLKFQIMTKSTVELAFIQGVDEGMEHRLKETVKQVDSYDMFVDKIIHKTWNISRVQRMCLAIVLNMTKADVLHYRQNDISYLRILGMTDTGKAYIKKLDNIRVITQIKREDIVYLNHQIHYDDIYELIRPSEDHQNFRRIIRYDR